MFSGMKSSGNIHRQFSSDPTNVIRLFCIMNIIADSNIPFVKEAFSEFGNVTLVAGREIDNGKLLDVGMLLVRSVTAVDRKLIKDTPVKFVGTATAGVDHIDIGCLKEFGIGFASAPGSNAESVAEYVASALVHLSHSLKISLAEKVIGIIGVGNVGSRVASVAKALGMHCLLNDPPLQRSNGGCLYSSLDEVLRTSDVITMHVPLTLSGTYATVGMANDKFFKKMKPNAIFINSSRGRVISEDALIIHRKKLSGVVLDVWKGEPEIDLRTVALANIATPHIAGHSFDGKVNGTSAVYEGACEFFGREKKWDSIIGDSVFERKIIDVRDSPDPVFTAVQSAYPIMSDDSALRNSLLKEDRGKCFENMRTKYDKRYEFRHFSVIVSEEQSAAALTLKGLGFICQ